MSIALSECINFTINRRQKFKCAQYREMMKCKRWGCQLYWFSHYLFYNIYYCCTALHFFICICIQLEAWVLCVLRIYMGSLWESEGTYIYACEKPHVNIECHVQLFTCILIGKISFSCTQNSIIQLGKLPVC